MENRLGQHGQTSMENREDNTAGELRTKDRTAADPSYIYLKIQILWLASKFIQAFHVVMARYGGGAAVAGFILQVLFFYLRARRANKFGNEEQRHDWLERHNAQRQRWESVTSASVLLVWNIVRQARLRSSKDRGSQPFRGSWTQQERLKEKLQGVQGWLARLISPHLALMVTLVPDLKARATMALLTEKLQRVQGWLARLISPHLALMVTLVLDVKARATRSYRALVPTAQQARRSSEDSEAPLIKSEVQEHRFGYVHAGVKTEIEDHSATVLKDPSDEPAGAEQATHVREIQSLRWPGQVLENRISILVRFRALASQEKRQKERLIHKDLVGTLTSQEMRDLKNLESLDFEADYSTLRIPQVREFHGFDGILSPSATNENVWQLLVPALWTFALGRPTCVFFDGYSGTGKSYTMFKGPNAIAGQFTWALDAFLRTRGVDRKFDVATATLQHDRGKDPGKVVQGPSTKGASLQEARGKIEEAWQQRDGTSRKTANNLESSRSHLIIDLSVDVMIRGKRFQSSLGLVDLAGNEKEAQGHDRGATKPTRETTAKEEAEAERQAQERSCIHNSRSALQSSLLDPSNLSAINSSEFTRHLRKYLWIEKKTRNTPESKSAKLVQRSLSTREQQIISGPKVFLVSCLRPFKSKLRNAVTTLNFATELRSKEAGHS